MNLLNLESVSKAFDIRPLLDGVSLGVHDNERIGIVGRNGDGKSTLLKIMAGTLEPDSGRVAKANSVKVGILSQSDSAAVGATVREVVLGDIPIHEWASNSRIREVLAGLFGGHSDDLLDRDFHSLSGGERRRVNLAKLLVDDLDLVLLDEPTNHLDPLSWEILAEALKEYQGTVLLVSHDRMFIDQITDKLWVFENHQITQYFGNLSQYLMERR